MSKSMIVIGDVHGCYETLLKLIEQLPKDIPICFAGDLIDRGPKSKQVVEHVRSLESRGTAFCVKGNHEQMMIDSDGQIDWYSDWAVYNGGRDTMESYDPDADIEIFKGHTEWMKTLPVFLEFKDIKNDQGRHLVVSHSTIGGVWSMSSEDRKNFRDEYGNVFENRIMWDRVVTNDAPGIYNIFGHTPQPEPLLTSFYANVDTGCVFQGRSQYGFLTAIQFPEMKTFKQANVDIPLNVTKPKE